jgi:signal peptidase I
MLPTIKPGDVVFADPIHYKYAPVRRFDIIVVRHSELKEKSNGQDQLYVDRVIALGGEKVEVGSTRVYIDDRELAEQFDHITFDPDYPVEDFGPVVVPRGAYFLLDDNRPNARIFKRFTVLDDIYGKVTSVKDQAGHVRYF